MDFTVGTIVDGKVKSITKFGAFISLPGNRTGMVHISEIHEHLTEGQDVKVMVISADPAGKINLSIKRTQEPPKQPDRGPRPQQSGGRSRPPFDRSKGQSDRPRSDFRSAASREPQSFDDMLKQFMQDSDSKISSLKQYSDHKSKGRRR